MAAGPAAGLYEFRVIRAKKGCKVEALWTVVLLPLQAAMTGCQRRKAASFECAEPGTLLLVEFGAGHKISAPQADQFAMA
jgi:hypothetical protein